MPIFRYQYVVKLENIHKELPYVVEQLAGTDAIKQQLTKPHDSYTNLEKVKDLGKVPFSLVQEVAEIYRDDFEMFGYEMPIDGNNFNLD